MTTTERTNPREARGLVLSQDKRIKSLGKMWLVPSQSGADGYVVNLAAGTCTCPDFETRAVKCKHQFAVEFVQRETVRETVTTKDGTTAVRETTREVRVKYTQNWPAYNAAQTTERSTSVGFCARSARASRRRSRRVDGRAWPSPTSCTLPP